MLLFLLWKSIHFFQAERRTYCKGLTQRRSSNVTMSTEFLTRGKDCNEKFRWVNLTIFLRNEKWNFAFVQYWIYVNRKCANQSGKKLGEESYFLEGSWLKISFVLHNRYFAIWGRQWTLVCYQHRGRQTQRKSQCRLLSHLNRLNMCFERY